MRRYTVLWIAAALLLTTASASADEVSDYDRFHLWNGCKPMMFIGPKLSDDATSIGLTKDAIEVAARSRLRAARLYAEDLDEAALSFLIIQVDVGSGAFSVRIAYSKRMRDLATGLELVAISWDGT